MPEEMDMKWEGQPSTAELCSHNEDKIEKREEFYGLQPTQLFKSKSI